MAAHNNKVVEEVFDQVDIDKEFEDYMLVVVEKAYCMALEVQMVAGTQVSYLAATFLE